MNVTLTLTVPSGSPDHDQMTWSGSGAKVDNFDQHQRLHQPITVSNLTSGLIFVNGNATINGQMTGASTS